jgi:hypothetical protein
MADDDRLPELPSQVTDKVIAAYRADGVVCLRGVFAGHWMGVVRAGFERNLAKPGRRATVYRPGSDDFVGDEGARNFVAGKPFVLGESAEPRFFNDCTTWQDNAEYSEFVRRSPAAAIAKALMGSAKVNILFEDILIKEALADAPTPWHHDVPFWPVLGSQVCGVWLPLDPVTEENRVRFIRGSHRWGRRFLPMAMVDPDAHYGIDLAAAGYEATPDFDAEIERHEILTWNLEPGDCLVFDGHVVHGAPPNRVDRPRRIFATRWTGDDCVYAGDKHAQIGPPFPHADVKRGAPMDGEVFPVILPR